jgi:hypothetical protein
MGKRSRRNNGSIRVSGWHRELEQARRKWLHRQVRFFDAEYSHQWEQGEVMDVTPDGEVIVVYSPGPGVYCGAATTLARAESILTIVGERKEV